MRMAYLGMSGVMSAVVRSEVKNALMIESELDGEWTVPFFPGWVRIVSW
jgi:hypothetical protein